MWRGNPCSNPTLIVLLECMCILHQLMSWSHSYYIPGKATQTMESRYSKPTIFSIFTAIFNSNFAILSIFFQTIELQHEHTCVKFIRTIHNVYTQEKQMTWSFSLVNTSVPAAKLQVIWQKRPRHAIYKPLTVNVRIVERVLAFLTQRK